MKFILNNQQQREPKNELHRILLFLKIKVLQLFSFRLA